MAAHVRNARRERRNRPERRLPRLFRDRSNPLEDLDEGAVFARYRFRPDTIMFILESLPPLASRTQRNLPIPPLLQLLVTLRYLATGAMYILIGDSLNLSKDTVGRIVRKVSSHIANLFRENIRFPSQEESVRVKQGFARIAGFPNVVGCVDGTLIRIKRPVLNEVDFVNRKGYHSLNVQMCCDHRFKILSCNASWPGSVHDSRVFRSSGLCAMFENGNYDGILLGDSGYPCRHFLMTPYLNPNTPGKARFNEALCRTRVLIEQTFGILKRRFQILHFQMQCSPERAVINTVACAVLHNIGISRGDIVQTAVVEQYDDEPQVVPHQNEDGGVMRDHIAQRFFTL